MKESNGIANAGFVALIVMAITACGGSSSTPPPIVEPPVVVAGLTLDEIVEKFEASGTNLVRNVFGKTSFDSGANSIDNVFDFSVSNSNGAIICFAYTGQNNESMNVRNFTFSEIGCGREVYGGGKADFDALVNEFSGYTPKAFVNSQVSGSYDIFSGSDNVSFKLNNGDVSECRDSVTNSSNYITASKNSETGNVDLSVASGIFADESSEGESFSVSCDVVGTDGESYTFLDVANYNSNVSSIPAKRLVQILAENSGNEIRSEDVNTYLVEKIGDDVENTTLCTGVLDNSYGTRTCVEYLDNDFDTVTSRQIGLNSEGIDYHVSIGGKSDISEISSDLSSRLGTPVVKQAKNYLADNLYYDSDAPTFQIKNVDLSNSTCNLDSEHTLLNGMEFDIYVDSELTNQDFNKYSVGQFQENFNKDINPVFLEPNGDYNLGNLNCTFNSPNLGETVLINNILSISGNINDTP